MIVLRCALQYLIRELFRTTLVTVGLASAFGATSLMYGIAGQVAFDSTSSLRWVLGDTDLWILPYQGARIDQVTGAIVCEHHLPADFGELLKRFDVDATFKSFLTTKIEDPLSGQVVVYVIADRESQGRASCAADLWARHAGAPFDLFVAGKSFSVNMMDEGLPSRTVAIFVADLGEPPNWITVVTKTPGRWIRSRQELPFAVRDTPQFDYSNHDSRPVVYPLTTSAGRFNSYTFDARFDALILNHSLNSSLGIYSRLVLAFGIVVAVVSTIFGLREKATLIAVLTAHGITGELIGILLCETIVLCCASWMLGTALAIFALKLIIIPSATVEVLMQGIAITVVFIPSIVMIATLVAITRLLSRTPAQLVKAAFV